MELNYFDRKKVDVFYIFSLMSLFIISILKLIVYNNTK